MTPIKLALLWHQHQPYYRTGNEFRMPWAWLHATKDYLEMAEHFERHPAVRGTINLVPSLIKQIQEYLSGEATDRVVDLMTKDAGTLWSGDQIFMVDNFFLANQRVIDESPRYRELFDKANRSDWQLHFELQDYRDLAVHYSLAWTGEIARGREPFETLVKKDRGFSEEDKQSLAKAQMENVRAISPLHQKLAMNGQIELTTTPFYHPILPLLIDTEIALEAMPDVPMPHDRLQAPEEAEEQIRRAREFFKNEIGILPKGMWPSEGSVSMDALRLIRKQGFAWTATDETILARSISPASVKAGAISIRPEHARFFPWRFDTASGEIVVFFRDHGLSDDIGFQYHFWNAADAVEHFIQNILRIRSDLAQAYGEDVLDQACISVILDGENCWEYYPRNGFEFLDLLYTTLTETPEIHPVTFSEALERSKHEELPKLPRLAAGSWIGGNFKIWIGHPEDNAAWDALQAAKAALDEASSKLSKMRGKERTDALAKVNAAHEELLIAEGSDWCWWYGDENFSAQKEIFDELYRTHLREVYLLLDRSVPEDLLRPIAGRFSTNPPPTKYSAMQPAEGSS